MSFQLSNHCRSGTRTFSPGIQPGSVRYARSTPTGRVIIVPAQVMGCVNILSTLGSQRSCHNNPCTRSFTRNYPHGPIFPSMYVPLTEHICAPVYKLTSPFRCSPQRDQWPQSLTQLNLHPAPNQSQHRAHLP